MGMLRPRIVALQWLGDPPPQLPRAATGAGGYDLEITEEYKASTFDPVSLSVGDVETADVPVTVGADGTRYTAYIRTRTQHGRTSQPAEAQIPLVAYDGDLETRPSQPTNLRVWQLADGAVRVQWDHRIGDGSATPAGFKVYVDRDWAKPKTSVTGAWARTATATGLTANRPYLISVRAVTAALDTVPPHYNYCGSTVARRIVPKNDPPPGLEAGQLSATLT